MGWGFDVVDDAYTRSQTATTGVMREPSFTMNNGSTRDVSQVSMGDPVGYVGGKPGGAAGNPSSSYVKLVVDNGNQMVTAFPTAGFVL